jgi:hypothetical protein
VVRWLECGRSAELTGCRSCISGLRIQSLSLSAVHSRSNRVMNPSVLGKSREDTCFPRL